MIILFLAALASPAAPGPVGTANTRELDLRCYQAMAMLAREESPRARALGIPAAAYFLGRIDRAGPGFDPAAADGMVPDADRAALISRCTTLLSESGLNLRGEQGEAASNSL
jgi:hypothetical protein